MRRMNLTLTSVRPTMLHLFVAIMTGFFAETTAFLALPASRQYLAPPLDHTCLRATTSHNSNQGSGSSSNSNFGSPSDAISIGPTPNFDYERTLPESDYCQVLTSTLPIARELREFWDKQFQDPRQPDAKRFAWDPWYVQVGDGRFGNSETSTITSNQELVEGELQATQRQIQYSLKRTTTSTFFNHNKDHDNTNNEKGEVELYNRLVTDLVDLGSSIGLTGITPPWISLYTEGDMQNFHTDAPHGPLAFVLSLSREGEFLGGETMMLQPRMLEYWRGFDGNKGIECASIMRYIPPVPLGRCIAFDPRVPHGVNRVTGTQDPRKGRIVIHGWFNQPETCWFGPWDTEEQNKMSQRQRLKTLDAALEPLVETLGTGEIGRVMGYLAVRLDVDSDGLVNQVNAVCDTLQADWDDFRGIIGYDEADNPVLEDAASDVRLTAFEVLKGIVFEPGPEGRAVVVPFVFE